MSGEPFCSDLARAGGAALGGTASRAELWLLLEHDGPWGADAVVDHGLPAGVGAWLGTQVAALGAAGKARALLVRQERGPGAAQRDGVRGFLAVAREDGKELYAFAADLGDLPGLDLAAALAAGTLVPAPEPVTLICVNGRRDRCCARRGLPTYRALAERLGCSVWQSTHQGGHRYAATGLWLPEGVAYGFLGPEDAPALASARARGALHLPRFRGRTFHPAPAQAADALVRAQLGIDALDAWRLEALRREAGGAWRVALAGSGGRVEALVEETPDTVLASCSPPKEKRSERFVLRSWTRA